MLSVVMLNVIMLSVVMLGIIRQSVVMLHVIMLNVIMLNVIMLNVVMLNVVMLNVLMLNVIMLNVIMLNVIMLNVVMLNILAPEKTDSNKHASLLRRDFNYHRKNFIEYTFEEKGGLCQSTQKKLALNYKSLNGRKQLCIAISWSVGRCQPFPP